MTAYVVVPCPHTLLHRLDETLRDLRHPTVRTIVVSTDDDPITPCMELDYPVSLWGCHLVVATPPTDVARLWNVGIAYAAGLAHDADLDTWDVFCTRPGVRGRPDSVALLTGELRRLDLAMVGPSWCDRTTRPGFPTVFGCDDARDASRLPASCFALAGERGMRYAEDLEFRARCVGRGTAVVADTGLRSMSW